MPLVSVIIPAYNSAKYISECLDSVLTQSLSDIEIIVVDDGSTDDTFSIVKSYASDDSRVRALQQQNQFAGVARNNGMAHATGEYLYFLDSDDFIDKDMLRIMIEAARSCDADVTVCRSRRLSMNDHKTAAISYALRDYRLNTPLTQQDVAKTLFRSVVGWPWDKLFKRSFIESHRLEYQPLRSTNDAYFVFVAMALAETVFCVDKELVTHRVDNMSSISNTRNKSWNNALIAMNAIGDRLHEEGIYGLFERTYVNWCVNFTHWNITTLDDESATGLIGAARELLSSAPTESREYYYLGEDYEFARLMHMNEDELVLVATRQRDEIKIAKRIYSTRAFKLAKKFEKSVRFIYHGVLKK